MSNAVRFLESIACQPNPMSAAEFAAAVGRSDLPAEMKQALLARDIDALSASLGGRAQMLCMVVPAENDEPVEEDPEHEEGDSPDSSSAARVA